jgi:hypothetical protein
VGDLDAPGVADGSEHRLLVVPPDPPHLKPWRRPSVRASAAVTPRFTRTSSSRSVTP